MKQIVLLCASVVGGSCALAGTVLPLSEVETDVLEEESLGIAELAVEVIDVSDGIVDFRFTNTGPDAAVITNVYFNDVLDMYAEIASVDDERGGVSFSDMGSGDPGGHDFSSAFTLASDGVEGGVGNGEWLGVRFALNDGVSIGDLLSAFSSGQGIGAMVQDPDTGQTEFFRTRDPSLEGMPLVPLPAPGVLAIGGLSGLFAFRRRQRI